MLESNRMPDRQKYVNIYASLWLLTVRSIFFVMSYRICFFGLSEGKGYHNAKAKINRRSKTAHI